jgi:hypothetical protein
MVDSFDPPPGRPEPRPFALSSERRSAADEPADQPYLTAAPTASSMSRHAAEWGLASLLMGGFILIITSVVLVFALQFWVTGGSGVERAADWAAKLTIVGAVIAALILIGLSAASLAIGIRALQSAAQRRQPAGLALAGTLVSAVALVLFTLMAIGTIMVILTFTG